MRMSEEAYAAEVAKRTRWQKGSAIVNTAPAVGVPTVLPISAPAGAPSKYRNVKTDGYASKKEAKRAAWLKHLQANGAIRNLTEQVRYLLIPKQDGERKTEYVADFVYDEDQRRPTETAPVWVQVVEDCKGWRTDTYRLKRKLMLFVHGIKIRET